MNRHTRDFFKIMDNAAGSWFVALLVSIVPLVLTRCSLITVFLTGLVSGMWLSCWIWHDYGYWHFRDLENQDEHTSTSGR